MKTSEIFLIVLHLIALPILISALSKDAGIYYVGMLLPVYIPLCIYVFVKNIVPFDKISVLFILLFIAPYFEGKFFSEDSNLIFTITAVVSVLFPIIYGYVAKAKNVSLYKKLTNLFIATVGLQFMIALFF